MTTTLPAARGSALAAAARQFGTPAFVYFTDDMRTRVHRLAVAFGQRFTVSYAMKCNPNISVLRALRNELGGLDASSSGEIRRGLAAGYAATDITFSGPAKRDVEIDYAVQVGCGAIVCESVRQIEAVNRAATRLGRTQPILIRVNPNKVPRRFGLQMGGRPSQFGIDEDAVGVVIARVSEWSAVDLAGLHVFSAGNSLDADAIVENIGLMADLFTRLVKEHDLTPRSLVFGSGFGIPYFDADRELDIERVAEAVTPVVEGLAACAWAKNTKLVLETGRWVVGPDGYLLTSVVDDKISRGTHILLCDAGFNNHLSACGMMGTVLRRDWRFWNLSRPDAPSTESHLITGPLCASFDVLGSNVALPSTVPGDVLVVGSSGAYGLTASPTRFISHPEPREVIVEAGRIVDVTESWLNHPDIPIAATEGRSHALA